MLRRAREARSLWAGLWFLMASATLTLILRWWPGDRLMVVRLVNYLMPWLLALLLPGLLAAALGRRLILTIALALPVAAILFHYAPLLLPRTRAASTGNTLKVMSYNVWSKNVTLEATASLIHRENPDILLLQEIKPWQLSRLKEALKDLYGGSPSEPHFTYSPKLFQAVMSPHPLAALEVFREKGQVQIVRVETPMGGVTVFNVHPLRGSWQRRHNQITALLTEEILTTRGPAILGGDFNTTDQTGTYRLLSKYLRNAHWEAGQGFGFTFPAPGFRLLGRIPIPPLVRIDHIFFSPHFVPVAAATLAESGGSDHLPVVAELMMIAPEKTPSGTPAMPGQRDLPMEEVEIMIAESSEENR